MTFSTKSKAIKHLPIKSVELLPSHLLDVWNFCFWWIQLLFWISFKDESVEVRTMYFPLCIIWLCRNHLFNTVSCCVLQGQRSWIYSLWIKGWLLFLPGNLKLVYSMSMYDRVFKTHREVKLQFAMPMLYSCILYYSFSCFFIGSNMAVSIDAEKFVFSPSSLNQSSNASQTLVMDVGQEI